MASELDQVPLDECSIKARYAQRDVSAALVVELDDGAAAATDQIEELREIGCDHRIVKVTQDQWSCPGLTDTTCKGRGTLEASVNHVITEAEEAGFAGEESGAAEAATS